MVLNTQCFPYLWLMMWFHAKKIQRKKCWLSYVDSVPRLRNYQKYTKKNLALIVITIFVFIEIILCIKIVFRDCIPWMCGGNVQARLWVWPRDAGISCYYQTFFRNYQRQFFCNLSSLTAKNLLFYICSQSQLLIKEEIQSKWVWHVWWWY